MPACPVDCRPLSFITQLLIRQGYASPSTIPSSTGLALASPSTLFAVLLPRFLPRCSGAAADQAVQDPYSLGWRAVLSGGSATFADSARTGESLLRHLLLGLVVGDAPVPEAACAQAGAVLHILLPTGDDPQLAEKVLLGVEAVSLAGGEAAVEARARIGIRWVGGPRRDEKGASPVKVHSILGCQLTHPPLPFSPGGLPDEGPRSLDRSPVYQVHTCREAHLYVRTPSEPVLRHSPKLTPAGS
jgi:hypothetical protein